MRKTIRSLEEELSREREALQRVLHKSKYLEEQVGFYTRRESLITTGIIALEKITDVVAHVVSDMKSLRDKPVERR